MSIRAFSPILLAFENRSRTKIHVIVTPLNTAGHSSFKFLASDGATKVKEVGVNSGPIAEIGFSVIGFEQPTRSLVASILSGCEGRFLVPTGADVTIRVCSSDGEETSLVLQCTHVDESAHVRLAYLSTHHVTMENVSNVDCQIQSIESSDTTPPANVIDFFSAILHQ